MGACVYGVGACVYGNPMILVSAQVPLVLGLGLRVWGLGLTTIRVSTMLCRSENRIIQTQLLRERGKFRAHLKHFICLLGLHMFTEWWYLSCLFEMKELNPSHNI